MAVRVVTDSACDLPPEMCEELGIEVVPLTIRFGDREYVDRKELTTDEFWRQLESSSVLPETAAPSVGAFEETFRRLHDDGADGIVCVNLSAHLSATMQSAQVAAKALDGLCPIEIIDSATRVDGHRHPRAARRAPRVATAPTSRRSPARSTTAATARSCSRRSTRSSTCARAAASAARRRCSGRCCRSSRSSPSIDGAVEQAGKVRTRSKALRFMLDQIPDGNVESICVLHSGADRPRRVPRLGAPEGARRRDRRRPHRPGRRRARRARVPSGLTWIERDG